MIQSMASEPNSKQMTCHEKRHDDKHEGFAPKSLPSIPCQRDRRDAQSGPKAGTAGAVRSHFVLKTRPPGTEFLDAETGRKKPSRKSVNASRDQSPESKWPEIPAEEPYLASTRGRVVCGDRMVVCAVICEPVSPVSTLFSLFYPVTDQKSGQFRPVSAHDQRSST